MRPRLISIICIAGLLLTVVACGPDSIFLKYGLDTPAHHTDNGYRFLDNKKYDAAFGEFNRAIELDPNYSPAYVGLGLAYGFRGIPEKAVATMQKARELARDEEQRKLVDDGFEKLKQMGIAN
jgi:tetratricopeptide (TPR) repeat protein